jgi:hypothetical protein
MNINLAGINWIAVIVTTVAVMMIGMTWYTVLFGKAWQRLNGFSDEKVKQLQAARPPAIFLGGMLVSYLVMATVMAMMLNAFGVRHPLTGLAVGGSLWVGVALPLGVTAWLPSDKPLKLYLIDWAYQLVILALSGTILGWWTRG